MSQATSDSARDARFDRFAIWTLLAGALLVRTAAIVAMRGALALDVDNYRELAENLLRNGVFGQGDVVTAYRPPLYPLLLAALGAVGQLNDVAIAALHVALGVATVGLVAVVGRQWGLGRWRFLAAALVACDPILLRQSSVVMTETLATFLTALALVALSALVAKPTTLRAIAAGATLGLGVLCRPGSLLWLISAMISLLWVMPTSNVRFHAIAGVALSAAVVLFPWAARNQLQFGLPIVMTTHGGMTALLGNNPEFYEHLRASPGEPWDSAEFNQRVEAERVAQRDDGPNATPFEIANDRREGAQAWRNIQAEPAMFARAAIYRLGRLWGVAPLPLAGETSRARVARYIVSVWYSVEFAWALLGAWSLGKRLVREPWVFGLLLAAALTVAHSVYWTDLRMRAPACLVVSLAAAAGAGWIGRKISCRKASAVKELERGP
jgi:4-amino-4-deoxy-L-arabinose transferase-like glycosyltransferase